MDRRIPVLTAGKTSGEMNPDSLRAREEILVGLIETNIEQFDSLWQKVIPQRIPG